MSLSTGNIISCDLEDYGDVDDNSDETICQDNNEMNISTENIKSSNPEENIITNLIEKLSAQPIKSAFNNYLRKNFYLLIQKPQGNNDISKSIVFVCDICNLVLCNHDDWIKHDNRFHSKNLDFMVLFCNICRIYHVSTYKNIDHHLMTMEHIIMESFQKYQNKNVIKPSINNINNCNKNSNPTNEDKGSDFNVEIKQIENSNEYIIKKTIYIEIKSEYYFILYAYFIKHLNNNILCF